MKTDEIKKTFTIPEIFAFAVTLYIMNILLDDPAGVVSGFLDALM